MWGHAFEDLTCENKTWSTEEIFLNKINQTLFNVCLNSATETSSTFAIYNFWGKCHLFTN